MTHSPSFDDYTSAALNDSPSIIINCECGHTRIFSTNTEFNKELLTDNLPYTGGKSNPIRDFYEQDFTYTCSECNKTGNWTYIADLPTTKCIVIEPHINQKFKDTTNDRTESASGLSLDFYTCPDCGANMGHNERRTDGEFPELGWEYYVCSSCDGHYPPHEVNDI